MLLVQQSHLVRLSVTPFILIREHVPGPLVDIISGQKSMNLCPAGQYLTGHHFALQIILESKAYAV
jgi:hypothetical protein